MITLNLALDWTPNANHIGFFVAQELGFYNDVHIEVAITNSLTDNYNVTPAKKVELGKVDMALCPLEGVISYQTKLKPFHLIAIAALFQEDLSAIVCKKSKGIKRPKDLDHTTYASYDARYEDAIVKQMIKNDGGKGILECVYPDKLKIWDAIESGKIESTWVFTNWEAVQAADSSIALEYFKLKNYGIPYSYSPVIVCSQDFIEDKADILKAFLQATKKGFYYAKQNPSKAADILKKRVPEKDKQMNLIKAIKLTCEVLGEKENWGKMNSRSIEEFLNWLQDHNLEKNHLKSNSLFTNNLL